nr:DUF4998 domain-containing protein [uncultured Draconibacterium sp.]
MKKTIKILIALVFILNISGCSEMDDNYVDYLKIEKVYAPKISNLKALVGLKTATLTWDNPEGDIARKILIDYQDDSLKFESMVDTAVLENLEIKGYHVSVYTIDAFNNYSIPVSIQIFPNGEN